MVDALSQLMSGSAMDHDAAEVGGFLGHYVVVMWFDDERDAYLILDPASSMEQQWLSRDDFDRARRSPGTDEDLLFIPWEQPALRVEGPPVATGDEDARSTQDRTVSSSHMQDRPSPSLRCGGAPPLRGGGSRP